MKFSATTIKILENFAVINQVQFFSKGKTLLSAVAAQKWIIARTQIEDEITQDFALHNLPRFLGIIRLFKDPVLEISDDEKTLSVTEDDRVAHLTLAPLDIIEPPSEKQITFPIQLTFSLTKTMLNEVKAAANIFEHENVVIIGENGQIHLETTTVVNETDDRYRALIGKTKENCRIALKASNLQLLSKDYVVEVGYTGVVRFRPTGEKPLIEYHVPIEQRISLVNGIKLEDYKRKAA